MKDINYTAVIIAALSLLFMSLVPFLAQDEQPQDQTAIIKAMTQFAETQKAGLAQGVRVNVGDRIGVPEPEVASTTHYINVGDIENCFTCEPELKLP
jgi:hypothetical protein